MKALQEFQEFILRGNVVDLAVGVVVGASFGSVVGAFTKDILTPLIRLPGKISLSEWVYGKFHFGDFINTAVSFFLTAAVVFFLVVKPINWLMSRRKSDTPADPETRECQFCLSKVPTKATRCAFCTSELKAVA